MENTPIDMHYLRVHPDAKVIISPGYSSPGMIESLLVEGAKGFLRKPFGRGKPDWMIAGTTN